MSSSRTVRVVLVGEDKASGAFGKAGKSVDQLDGHLRKVSAGMGVVAARLGVALGAASLGAVAGIAKVGMAYQNSLNTFQAVSHATTEQMDQVRRQAKLLGADMSLPATSAAGAAVAMTELAKAGLTVSESMAAAKGTLQLAAAAQVDEATAAGLTANALNAFHLQGSEAVRVADLLAAAANASSGEITDFGLGMQQAGATFAAAHIPIQALTAGLAQMANNGIKGSDAGTSLKTMLQKLQGPSGKAADVMKKLGFSIYDAHGQMKPFRQIISELTDKTKGMTDAQRGQFNATVFGTDATRAALTVLEAGTGAYDKNLTAVTHQGAAAEVAAAKTKGLSGALQGVKSQLETVAINIYEKAAPAVERGVRKVADAIPKIADTVGHAFDRVVIDLTPMIAKVKADAARIGTELLAGVKKGIDTGDWSALAKSIEKGITGSLNGLGRVMDKLGQVLSKVDWMKYGIAAGKQAPAFLLGIVLGFLNADWGSLIIKLGQHWMLVVGAILTVGLAPEAIGGRLVLLLRKIPFVGKFVGWLAEGFVKISAKLVDAVGGLLGKLGSAFLRGMGFAGKAWVASLKAEANFFLFRLQYYASTWATALVQALERMAGVAGKGVRKLGSELWFALKNVAGGIARDIGGLLVDAGKLLIKGLVKGIGASFGAVKNKLGELTGKLTSWKGPPSTDSTILFGAGQLVIAGFIAGLESKYSAVRASLASLTAGLPGMGLSAGDITGAQGRANETPVQAAQRQRDAVKATIAGLKGIDAAAAHLADTTARTAGAGAAHVAQLVATTRAAQDEAHALHRSAQEAAARAAAMPAHTKGEQAAKAAAQAHAHALLEEARSADDAARRIGRGLTDARNASTKAATAATKASSTAKAAAKDLSDAMTSLAEKQAALADAAYADTLARGSAFLDTLKTQMQALVDKAQSLRDAFSGSVTGGSGLADIYAKVTGDQQKAADDAAKARDDATKQLVDAQTAATDAQTAYDQAAGNSDGTTTDLADASTKLAAAQLAVVDATAAVAKASDDVAAVQERTKLTVQTILDELKTRVLGAQDFAQSLGELTGMGLSDGLIQQIAGAGVETGAAIAHALQAAGPGGISALNDLTSQLQRVATTGVDGIAASLYGPAASIVASMAEGIRSQLPELSAAVDEILAMAKQVDASIQAVAASTSTALTPTSVAPAGDAGGISNSGSLDPRYIAGLNENLWTAGQRNVADLNSITGQRGGQVFNINGYNSSPAELAAELAWQMK